MTLLDPPLNRSYLVFCIWQQNYILTESCFPSFKFFSYLNEIISSVVDIFLLPRHPPQSIDDVPLEVVQVLLVGGVVAAVLHVAEVSLGQPRHQQDITVQERSHDQIETKVGIGLVEATILSFLVANSNSSFYGSYIVIWPCYISFTNLTYATSCVSSELLISKHFEPFGFFPPWRLKYFPTALVNNEIMLNGGGICLSLISLIQTLVLVYFQTFSFSLCILFMVLLRSAMQMLVRRITMKTLNISMMKMLIYLVLNQ